MNTNILSNYLIDTLVPALHEKRIHIGDDTYRVHVTGRTEAGEFVHIERMCSTDEDDHWTVVATPGWDGATTTIPIQVEHDAGEVILTETPNATGVSWTGKLEYDVQIYLHTVRNHIIKVILPALWPDSTEEPKTHTIVVLDDGETWAGGGCPVELTQAEYDRIMEGEKVHDVAPDRCDYIYGPWAD